MTSTELSTGGMAFDDGQKPTEAAGGLPWEAEPCQHGDASCGPSVQSHDQLSATATTASATATQAQSSPQHPQPRERPSGDWFRHFQSPGRNADSVSLGACGGGGAAGASASSAGVGAGALGQLHFANRGMDDDDAFEMEDDEQEKGVEAQELEQELQERVAKAFPSLPSKARESDAFVRGCGRGRGKHMLSLSTVAEDYFINPQCIHDFTQKVQRQLTLFSAPAPTCAAAPAAAGCGQTEDQRSVVCLRWFPRGSLGLQRRLVAGLCRDLGLDLLDLSSASLSRPSVELQNAVCKAGLSPTVKAVVVFTRLQLVLNARAAAEIIFLSTLFQRTKGSQCRVIFVTSFESTAADPVVVNCKSHAEAPTTPGVGSPAVDGSSSSCKSPATGETMFRLCVEEPVAGAGVGGAAVAAATATTATITGRKRRQPHSVARAPAAATVASAAAAGTGVGAAGVGVADDARARLVEKKEAVVKVVRDHIRNLLQTSNTEVVKVDFQFRKCEAGVRRLVLRGRLNRDAVATRARDHAECVSAALEASHGVRLGADLVRGVYRFFLVEPLNSLQLRRSDYSALTTAAAARVDPLLLATAATATAATLAGGAATAGVTLDMHARSRAAQKGFVKAVKAVFLAHVPESSSLAAAAFCGTDGVAATTVSPVCTRALTTSTAVSAAVAVNGCAAEAGLGAAPGVASAASWLGARLGTAAPPFGGSKPFLQQLKGAAARAQQQSSSNSSAAIMRQMEQNVVRPEQIDVTFDNIGGLVEAKTQVLESVVVPHRCPHLFQGVLADVTKGVLLYGPPGTGKTMLAKAIARECRATFINVSAANIHSKWAGDSEKAVSALFATARRLSPAIIFIDEVDSLLRARGGSSGEGGGGGGGGGGGTSFDRKVVNMFLQEWDGLCSKMDGRARVTVLGATNRPQDLDEAVLRRFEVRCLIDIADAAANEEILRRTLRGDCLQEDAAADAVDLAKVARVCHERGYSASDVVALCRQAAWVRVREHISRQSGAATVADGDAGGAKKKQKQQRTSDEAKSGAAHRAARLAALMALARGGATPAAQPEQPEQARPQPTQAGCLRPICGRDFESTFAAATQNGSLNTGSRVAILEWHRCFGTHAAGEAAKGRGGLFGRSHDSIAQMYS